MFSIDTTPFRVALLIHLYSGVIMASQITGVSTVCSRADQRKYQSSASLAFCERNPPVNSPHKGPVTRKCFHLMTSKWLRPEISDQLFEHSNFMHFANEHISWECVHKNPNNNKPPAFLSGDGFASNSVTPLSDPMIANIFDTVRRHRGHNDYCF